MSAPLSNCWLLIDWRNISFKLLRSVEGVQYKAACASVRITVASVAYEDLNFGTLFQARGLVKEALDVLARKGHFHLANSTQEFLIAKGFADIVCNSCDGKENER